jgi:hypothetical protein
MAGLPWKLQRLRTMTLREVFYRTGKLVQAVLEKHGFGLARPARPAGSAGHAWVDPLPYDFGSQRYTEAADRVLDGQFDLFAHRKVPLGFPPPWNTNPLTGEEGPLVFGKTIDYRDQRLVGDVKYLWEPNRHFELVTLAQAWHLTRESRYLNGCRALLLSWLETCPYPIGPNWTSALEAAFRLVNWAVSWHLLGGYESPLFKDAGTAGWREKWLSSVYCHCHFIAGHLSRYSSANNHLLGELMGLYIGALTWPFWSDSHKWRDFARSEFVTEALKQNAADGVNLEQAIWYQHEVVDMMLLVGLFSRTNGICLPCEFWNRIEKMLEFIASVMDRNGHVPMIGDADDAVIVRFSPNQEFDVYRSLLATGAVLFQRSDFKSKAGGLDDKTVWLLGTWARGRWHDVVDGRRDERRMFACGGYFVLGQDFDTSEEVRVVADAGPIGYLAIAAHGHADALALTLSVSGHEILVDPGTYMYQPEEKWRQYFRGTSAHNTIRIDRENQCVSGGRFAWLQVPAVRCVSWSTREDEDILVAEHDGYLRLRDGAFHTRRLRLVKATRTLTVLDTIICRRAHFIEQFWHFAETCDIQFTDAGIVVTSDSVSVRCKPDAKLTTDVVRGNDEIPLGWISRRYGTRVSSPTLRCYVRIVGTTHLVTEFYI